jgi:predicted SnoaL-like aldol condensation-catalyzing enzyme
MGTAAAERDKAFVLEAFDTLVNRRDYTAAQRFWSPDYIQHSAHIPPGREGLFNLVKGQQDHSGHRAPAKRADAEHWDVVQDEATAEESKSGLPMFGDSFPTRA